MRKWTLPLLVLGVRDRRRVRLGSIAPLRSRGSRGARGRDRARGRGRCRERRRQAAGLPLHRALQGGQHRHSGPAQEAVRRHVRSGAVAVPHRRAVRAPVRRGGDRLGRQRGDARAAACRGRVRAPPGRGHRRRREHAARAAGACALPLRQPRLPRRRLRGRRARLRPGARARPRRGRQRGRAGPGRGVEPRNRPAPHRGQEGRRAGRLPGCSEPGRESGRVPRRRAGGRRKGWSCARLGRGAGWGSGRQPGLRISAAPRQRLRSHPTRAPSRRLLLPTRTTACSTSSRTRPRSSRRRPSARARSASGAWRTNDAVAPRDVDFG